MWRRVGARVVLDVAEERSAFTFRFKQLSYTLWPWTLRHHDPPKCLPQRHIQRLPGPTPCIARSVRLQFWNPSVHYNVRKRTLLDTVLSHMNPLHTVTPCFFKVSEVLPSSVLCASPTRYFFHHLPARDSSHGTQRQQVQASSAIKWICWAVSLSSGAGLCSLLSLLPVSNTLLH